MGTGVAGTAVKLVNLFSSEDEEVPCGVWGFLSMIVYSSLLQVPSAKSSACGTGI